MQGNPNLAGSEVLSQEVDAPGLAAGRMIDGG